MASDEDLFNFSKKRFRTTEKEVEEALKLFAAKFPASKRGSKTYRTWKSKPISEGVIIQMFGSFKRALDKFGIENSARDKNYTDDQLIDFFETLWRWRKQGPSAGDFGRYRSETGKGISYEVYRDRYASAGWRKFLMYFSELMTNKISREEFLKQTKPRQKKSRRPIPMGLRIRVLEKFGGKCAICGAKPRKDNHVMIEIDHIVPVSKGGGNQIDNLRPLCKACNLGRGNRIQIG